MPRKTKIIFITVFILVGALIVGYYLFANKSSSTPVANTPVNYNPFTPSGAATSTYNTNSVPTPDQALPALPDTSAPDLSQSNSKFHQITTFAVAGATFFEDTRPLPQAQAVTLDQALPAGPTAPAVSAKTPVKTAPKPVTPQFEVVPALRYVERATGHIYEMYLDTKIQGEISNSTIPDIYEALFNGKAQSVVYRYLSDDDKTIESYVATLGSTKGSFLPENILEVALSPDKSKFFYLTQTGSGVVGTSKSFDETKTTQVFNSSFSEWLPQWVTDQKIFLTTKASSKVAGNLYSLSVANGTLSKIFGGVLGLTTLANHNGSLVLYSTSTPGGPNLGVLTVSNHTVNNLNASGLPEKCVWSADNINIYCALPSNISGGDYPDSWYKGQVSFNDSFVKINTSTNDVSTIADSNSGQPVDGTSLFLSTAEDQLFFINKKDSTLWSLDLK